MLREFLKALTDRFPNISVELTVDMSVNLTKELFERSIDLALQNGPFNRQTSGIEDLGSYPLVWVASPTSELRTRVDVTLADLAEQPILTHARNTALFTQVSEHFATRRDISPRFVPSSNLAARLHMTLNGMGIATLPAAMVSNELVSGELLRIDYDWAPQSLHFLARYDAEKSPRFVAKAAELASDVASAFTSKSSSRCAVIQTDGCVDIVRRA